MGYRHMLNHGRTQADALRTNMEFSAIRRTVVLEAPDKKEKPIQSKPTNVKPQAQSIKPTVNVNVKPSTVQPASTNVKPSTVQPASTNVKPSMVQPASTNVKPSTVQPASTNVKPSMVQPASTNVKPS